MFPARLVPLALRAGHEANALYYSKTGGVAGEKYIEWQSSLYETYKRAYKSLIQNKSGDKAEH
jgi:hypothetical protein